VARVTAHPENPVVNWELNPPVGAIASDGTYTAPVSLSSAQTVIATATSNLSAVASIAVVPAYDVLYPNQPQQFTANASSAGALSCPFKPIAQLNIH